MPSSRLRTPLALPVMFVLLVGVAVEVLAWGKAGHRVVATLTLLAAARVVLAPEPTRIVAFTLVRVINDRGQKGGHKPPKGCIYGNTGSNCHPAIPGALNTKVLTFGFSFDMVGWQP